MDYICGKRLQPILPELVTVLERHNEFRCDRETRAKLLRISAATIDRLLKPERRKHELRGRSGTKPGTLLKSKYRFALSPTGTSSNPALLKSIWWAMMAELPPEIIARAWI